MQMAKPRIMTVDEWLAATSLGNRFVFFHQDRKHLVPIDQALGYLVEAGKMRAGGSTYHEVDGCLWVLAACRQWLDAKGTKTSDNVERRRDAVRRLAKQALRLLKWHRDPAWRAAWDTFETNKSRPKATELKGLHGPFAREAAKPKGEPRMGATMVAKGLNFDSAHEVYGKFTTAVEGITNASNVTTKTELEELTDDEYRQIEELLFKWKGQALKTRSGDVEMVVKELVYMSKDDRIASMLVPRERVFYTSGGARFSTAAEPNKRMIYAVDEYGNFYAGRGEAGVTNHSSFNRGKGVLCAGEIQAKNGVPLFLSNGSGHYKPSTLHLRNAIVKLRDYGIPLDNMFVYDFQAKRAYVSGRNFLVDKAVPRATDRFNHDGNPLM
jgi:hypothetical protein